MTKQNKIKIPYSKFLPILLILATFFMSVGYAQMNSAELNVGGIVQSYLQDGVFISDVNYLSNVSADTTSSKINYYIGTMLDSKVVLGNSLNSSLTYKISIYNNSDVDYLFIGLLTDEDNNTLYSNDNIEIILDGIEEYETTIEPKQTINFTVTFKYIEGADILQNILSSKLNFRFQEVPILTLSNENEIYTLNDIYPGYTSQEYEFTVTNYEGEKINNVPMSYYFETTISSPLTVKIYDKDGNEVKDLINIEGDGQQKVTHTYTLKVIWDDSNPSDEIAYNSVEYANKQFYCNIALIYVPDSDKYLEYELVKTFDVDITTQPLYFNFESDLSIEAERSGSDLAIIVNNYNSSTEYNKFDINYEISITDNDKFTLSDDDGSSSSSVITKTLNGGETIDDSYNIKLIADINNLDVTENLTLNIDIKSPYVSQITHSLTLSLKSIKVTLNPNGGSVSTSSLTVYKGKTYGSLPTPTWTGHTFNGWYTSSEGGTKITNTTEVTTSNSTQTLYAQWTSNLLVDNVSTGDYVAYPVNYSNVASTSYDTYIPESTYVGWRVLDIKGSGDNRYVRLISAGVPLTYRHIANTTATAATSVSNLITNFFGIPFSTSTSVYGIYSCGVKTSSGSTVTTPTQLKTVFTNDYTQTNSNGPIVGTITLKDIENILGITVTNGIYITGQANNLFTVPSTNPTGYAGYYLATANGVYLWSSYREGGIIYTYGVQGLRPVVSLNIGVLTSGKVDGVWQINI